MSFLTCGINILLWEINIECNPDVFLTEIYICNVLHNTKETYHDRKLKSCVESTQVKDKFL